MVEIKVIHHYEPEGWWAESPDVDGWYAAGSTYKQVRQLAEEGVRFALEREDAKIQHFVPEDEVELAAAA